MDNSIIPISMRRSHWEYTTGTSGGASFMFVAGGGGQLKLKNPQGQEEKFGFGGIGVGAGFGARLPKIGKVNLNIRGKSVGATGATEDFPATGVVFVSDALRDRDLTRDDITGACAYVEVGGGVGIGYSGMVMLLGLDARLLALTLAMMSTGGVHRFLPDLLKSARGALHMRGANVGVQAGGGGAIYVGGLF
ncbi:hypothetical protein QO207_21875 [Pseudomonas sp. CAN2814]|jgi:hypothetical protein|uniref:hypothetical protein n=1 Tax=Pseudomonas sp. CAN1 TaxID=3046726 RepID=UPI00264718FF|nr:hypothetical protein [Pseudomonas sp. CAN1]MDN6859250.1 hypothetical protein [Pseudomonas sp. CAN1]